MKSRLWWGFMGVGCFLWILYIFSALRADSPTLLIPLEEQVTEYEGIDTSIQTLSPASPKMADETTAVLQPQPSDKPEPCVNINSADSTMLVKLPGIGPVLAQRIIALRLQRGSLNAPADLLEVKGIGEAKLGKIKPRICF